MASFVDEKLQQGSALSTSAGSWGLTRSARATRSAGRVLAVRAHDDDADIEALRAYIFCYASCRPQQADRAQLHRR